MRANIVGRGVVVPTGEHHIRMSFSPPGLGLGCGFSLAGLAALAALFVLGRRAMPPA